MREIFFHREQYVITAVCIVYDVDTFRINIPMISTYTIQSEQNLFADLNSHYLPTQFLRVLEMKNITFGISMWWLEAIQMLQNVFHQRNKGSLKIVVLFCVAILRHK